MYTKVHYLINYFPILQHYNINFLTIAIITFITVIRLEKKWAKWVIFIYPLITDINDNDDLHTNS